MSPQESQTSPTPQAWTVAVDLTTNLYSQSPDVHMGAENKVAQLRLLQNATRNVPVTIVVQKIADDADSKDKHRLERYVIQDGNLTRVQELESHGTAADLKSFIDFAGTTYPAKHVALAISAHGMGDEGISGDSGAAPIAALKAAIVDGLTNTTTSKIDVLNFDACLMAQVGVLKELAPVVDHLVASAEVEAADPKHNVDGQNLNDWLQHLLKNPDLKPTEFARAAITSADDIARALPPNSFDGASTLAHFDLQKYKQFEQKLDAFGEVLSKSAHQPENVQAIRKAIDGSPASAYTSRRLPSDSTLYDMALGWQKRDLTGFTDAIESGTNSGVIHDPDGKILKASGEMQIALTSLKVDYHSSNFDKSNGSNGLTIFLPRADLIDTSRLADKLSPLSRIEDKTSSDEDFESRRGLVATLNMDVETTRKLFDKQADAVIPLKNFNDAVKDVYASALGPEQPFDRAETMLADSAKALMTTGTYGRLHAEEKLALDDVLQSHIDSQGEGKVNGWKKFLDAVK